MKCPRIVVGILSVVLFGFMAGLRPAEAANPVWNALPELSNQAQKIQAGRVGIQLAPTGLPAQVHIEPSASELPLEQRAAKPSAALLRAIGRGDQLRAPVALIVEAKGQQMVAKETKAAAVAIVDGQAVASSELSAGGQTLQVRTMVSKDGAMSFDVTVGNGQLDGLTLNIPFAGPVDTVVLPEFGVAATAHVPEDYAMETGDGIVWGNADDSPGKAKAGAVTHAFVGNGDRGFTWLSESGGWHVDPKRSTALLLRDEAGAMTVQFKLINQPVKLAGKTTIRFTLIPHPSTMPADNRRRLAWLDWQAGDAVQTVDAAARSALAAKALPLVRAEHMGVAEAYCATALLRGAAGGDAAPEHGHLAMTYPMPMFRYLAGTYTGCTARIMGNAPAIATAGASRAADRMQLGRALLHDIGVDARGLVNRVENLRLMTALKRYGLFEADGKTEFVPYWRSNANVQFGEQFGESDAFALAASDPLAQVHCAYYRRPAQKGSGAQVMIVVVNEGKQAVREQLFIQDNKKVFGGDNRLSERKVLRERLDWSGIPEQSDWRLEALSNAHSALKGRVLVDLEDHGVVQCTKSVDAREVYGPIHIPANDFRIFMGTSGP